MIRILAFALAVLSLLSPAQANPVVSYILPDIGTPGMSTYIEIISPFDWQNPDLYKNNFGTDGLYLNNTTDNIRIKTQNKGDSWKITFGPCAVSWDGRLIAAQVFVHPSLLPNSWDWQLLNPEFKIPIQVLVNSVPSNIDTFYIVQPFPFGDQSTNAERVLGAGTLGKRSRRGAMLVDSMVLSNNTYTVSTNDCDPGTAGNQGFLPFVLMAKYRISGRSNTAIDVSGQTPLNGHAGNGGPGGGGGGGRFCDVIANNNSGDKGGDGFIGGGSGGMNYSISGGGAYQPEGNGSGTLGKSLNGCPTPITAAYEASGGATGHPFGKSGESCNNGGGCNPSGGAGGGSGRQQVQPGGSGGYGTDGSNSPGIPGAINGGKSHGNIMVVPLAGGSGGSSGNPQGLADCSGSGSGGGGAIAIYAPFINDFNLISNGGRAGSGSATRLRGGAGSGGYAGLYSKMPVNRISLQVKGGDDEITTERGGAGRTRLDVPMSVLFDQIPATSTNYQGVTSDTSKIVRKNCKITGSFKNAGMVKVYLKPESGVWQEITPVTTTASTWSVNLSLGIADTIYYLSAVQQVNSPTKNMAGYYYEPDYVMSQASANLLEPMRIPEIAGDSVINLQVQSCKGKNSGNDVAWLRNDGNANLNLRFDQAYFDAPGNGIKYNGFELSDPGSTFTVIPPGGGPEKVVVKYTYQQGAVSPVKATLYIPHNDNDKAKKNPWQIKVNVILDTFALKAFYGGKLLTETDALDLGSLCMGDTFKLPITLRNYSSQPVNLLPIKMQNFADKFWGLITGATSIPIGGSTTAEIYFSPNALGLFRTTASLMVAECDTAFTFDVVGKCIQAVFSAPLKVSFGSVRIGQSKTLPVKITNTGFDTIAIDKAPIIKPLSQTDYTIVDPSPFVPVLLAPGDSLVMKVMFKTMIEGTSSATMTVLTSARTSPKTCVASADIELTGDGVKSSLSALPLDFGLHASCESGLIDTVILHNKGITSIKLIQKASIAGADQNNFKIISEPNIVYDLKPGDSVLYRIELLAYVSPLGKKTALLKIRTDDVSDSVISVPLSADIDSLDLAYNPYIINFGGVPVPQKRNSVVTIVNKSRLKARIKDVYVKDYHLTINPPMANFTIAENGGTAGFLVFADFNDFVKFSDTIKVVIDEPCLDTIFIPVYGEGQEGKIERSIGIYFKDIAFCESDTAKFFIINRNDPVIDVLKMEILPQLDYKLFSMLGPEPSGISLQKDDRYERLIVFKPQNTTDGPKKAILATTIHINGKDSVITTELIGNRQSGLLAQPNEVNFGNVIIMTSKDNTLILRNDGPTKITLTNLRPLVNYPAIFTIKPALITNPIVLNKGETAQFTITFSPVDVKYYEDTLKIDITTSTCPDVRQVVLKGTGVPGKLASIWLPELNQVSPVLDNYGIPLCVRFDRVTDSLSGISLKAGISFNAALFYPTGTSANGKLLDSYVRNGRRYVVLTANNITITSNDSVLTELKGSTLLGDTVMTDLKWESFEWTMGNQISDPQKKDGYLEIKICKEGQDRLLRTSTPLKFILLGNPAGEQLRISVTPMETGEHTLHLVDMQGREMAVESWYNSNNDTRELILNTANISDGIYRIVLNTPARIQSQPVTIIK